MSTKVTIECAASSMLDLQREASNIQGVTDIEAIVDQDRATITFEMDEEPKQMAHLSRIALMADRTSRVSYS